MVISGLGCSLLDNLYTNVDFSSLAFRSFLSKKNGDGGLSPGRLVFKEDLEKYTGKEYPKILKEITNNKKPDKLNLGGPAIVALINASQLLNKLNVDVFFYGKRGNDPAGKKIEEIINKTPVNTDYYSETNGITPFTDVFSDSNYNNGQGERTFVNCIGTANDFSINDIDSSFFNSEILFFGATALLPDIHNSLDKLLKRGKANGAINIVTTVYDFISEKKNPDKPWPIGNSKKSFPLIDLLICDNEEALEISGKPDQIKAINFFKENGVKSCIVTHGTKNIYFYSNGKLFSKNKTASLPVSEAIGKELKLKNYNGDTTGCGDNFAGGVVASLANQLNKKNIPDIIEAISWGVASGGFACFYPGGTYLENKAGEKYEKICFYYKEYKKQINKETPQQSIEVLRHHNKMD